MRIKRLMAFCIDLVVAALLAILLNGILLSFNVKVITPMIAIVAWFILICKDCFGGVSIGRRIIGIQVISADTRKIANPVKCVLRNVFYFLTFVECIAMYYNSDSRRLGDYISHTEVAPYDNTLQKPNLSQSFLAIVYALIGLILFELFYFFRASSLGLL